MWLWAWIRRLFSRPLRGSEMLPVPRGRARVLGRRVYVRKFRLDVRPVTNAEYASFMRETQRSRPPWMHRPGFGEPEQPVVGVTYSDARAFARWAGKRLPTEAEWVRAARSSSDQPYPWGDIHPEAAHAHFRRGSRGAPADVTDPASRKPGDAPFGHRDLLGNVWEWCRGGGLRGGFWGSRDLSIELRMEGGTEITAGGVGFRCAR